MYEYGGKETKNSTSENDTSEVGNKNEDAEPENQDSTKPSADSNSKNTALNQKSINHVKELFEQAKEGKVPNIPYHDIQVTSRKLKKRGEKQIKQSKQVTECTQLYK